VLTPPFCPAFFQHIISTVNQCVLILLEKAESLCIAIPTWHLSVGKWACGRRGSLIHSSSAKTSERFYLSIFYGVISPLSSMADVDWFNQDVSIYSMFEELRNLMQLWGRSDIWSHPPTRSFLLCNTETTTTTTKFGILECAAINGMWICDFQAPFQHFFGQFWGNSMKRLTTEKSPRTCSIYWMCGLGNPHFVVKDCGINLISSFRLISVVESCVCVCYRSCPCLVKIAFLSIIAWFSMRNLT